MFTTKRASLLKKRPKLKEKKEILKSKNYWQSQTEKTYSRRLNINNMMQTGEQARMKPITQVKLINLFPI